MNELTTDEAAAWRAGAEAMREAAARACDSRTVSRSYGAHADAYEFAAAAIRALPLPEPPRHMLADGLSERGG
jgi:hypothetical protein